VLRRGGLARRDAADPQAYRAEADHVAGGEEAAGDGPAARHGAVL